MTWAMGEVIRELLVMLGAAGAGAAVYALASVLLPSLALDRMVKGRPAVHKPPKSRTKPDPIEAMAAAAGYPLGWRGPQWQACMVTGAMAIAGWGLLRGDPVQGILWGAAWPALVMAGLRRMKWLHDARRKQEAHDLLVGLQVLLHGEDVPGALQELAQVCPILAPALERCRIAWGMDRAAALSELAREVPELETAVAALMQTIESTPGAAVQAIQQEIARMRHVEEAALEARMDVQSQLFKLSIIPPGYTLIRVVFGAVWFWTERQFFQLP